MEAPTTVWHRQNYLNTTGVQPLHNGQRRRATNHNINCGGTNSNEHTTHCDGCDKGGGTGGECNHNAGKKKPENRYTGWERN